MTTGLKAVFLSYASQDAEAARRIADALRAAGIEVWFDQSELRSGDAWDRQITKQIRECALFIGVISAHTDARAEGYFRREWRVAVDRTRDMADDEAFLLPVVIDGTPDATARVPDKFREVQWSRLPAGQTPLAFVERVSRLLSPDQHVSPISPRPSSVPAPLPRQAIPTPCASRRSIPVPLLIALAVVMVGVGYLALNKFVFTKRNTVATQTSPASQSGSSAPGAIPEKSIAVLPFLDMSEKHDQEYFSDGLSEELIDLLTKVPDLRVPARTSSFFFKGKPEDIATIAQKLRVAHVLEGSVRKAANTIRVTAQLIRADNGYHLWSETYDRDIKDIFRVQDEIAAAVVAALKAKLLLPRQASTHRTRNTEAYNQYLLGRQFFNRANGPEVLRHAVDAYRKAIELDPNYAPARRWSRFPQVRPAARSIARRPPLVQRRRSDRVPRPDRARRQLEHAPEPASAGCPSHWRCLTFASRQGAEIDRMVILLKAEFSSISDTWTEYLCLEVGSSSVALSSRTYEHLGEWEEYAIDPEAAGDDLEQLPVTIDGRRVRGLDYGSVVGTELTIADEITLSFPAAGCSGGPSGASAA